LILLLKLLRQSNLLFSLNTKCLILLPAINGLEARLISPEQTSPIKEIYSVFDYIELLLLPLQLGQFLLHLVESLHLDLNVSQPFPLFQLGLLDLSLGATSLSICLQQVVGVALDH